MSNTQEGKNVNAKDATASNLLMYKKILLGELYQQLKSAEYEYNMYNAEKNPYPIDLGGYVSTLLEASPFTTGRLLKPIKKALRKAIKTQLRVIATLEKMQSKP